LRHGIEKWLNQAIEGGSFDKAFYSWSDAGVLAKKFQ
jgi:hypothetical protein